MRRSIGIEVAIGNVNKLVGVSESEVSVLENIFPCSRLILCNARVVNTRGELCSDVLVVFTELDLAMGVGPEDSFTVPVKGSDPVTLGADPTSFPRCPTTDCEFLSFPKLYRVIVLGLDRLKVFNDGSEVDVSVTEDIAPEGVRERRAISLGIEATDSVLWVEIVDSLEHLGFSLGAEACPTTPRGFSPACTPIPGVMWVVDIIVIARPF